MLFWCLADLKLILDFEGISLQCQSKISNKRVYFEPPSVDAERLMPDTLMSIQLMPGSIDAQEALLMPDSIDARLD